MTLASPLWLLLLLLWPVIVFFHTRPRRNVEVSSLILWLQSARAVPPRISPRLPVPNLLMFLQLLVVGAVALALARPVLGRDDRLDHWIVLVDASGSMRAAAGDGVPFARAEESIRAGLNGLEGSGTRVSVVRVASRAGVVAGRLEEPEQVREALRDLRPSDGRADWPGAAALVAGLMKEGERTRLTVLSDGSGAGEAERALAAASVGVEPEVVRFEGAPENLSLTGVTAELVNPDDGLWRIAGEMRAWVADEALWQPRSVDLRVLFAPAGTDDALEWASFPVELATPGVTGFEVDVRLPGAGVLDLRLGDDALPQDNAARFVLLGAPVQARVLYVGVGDPRLEAALLSVNGVALERATALPVSASNYDLVVLHGVAPPQHPGTNTLWVGASPRGAASHVLANASPTAWSSRHALARSVDWAAISVREAWRHEPLPGAEVLLEASGAPLLQARTTGFGREVVVSFGLDQTNWPEQLSFPAFIDNVVRWAVPEVGRAAATSCEAGVPCPLHPRELNGDWVLRGEDGDDLPLPSLYVSETAADNDEAAGGARGSGVAGESWLPAGAEELFTPEVAGIYTLTSGVAVRRIAVNALHAGEAEVSSGVGPTDASPTSAPSQSAVAPWTWLLLLALVALVAESWIAGRRTERFLYGRALARDNPLSGRRKLLLGLRALELALLIMALVNLPGLTAERRADAVVVVDSPEGRHPDAVASARLALAAAGDRAGGGRRLGLVEAASSGRVAGDLGEQIAEVRDAASATPPDGAPESVDPLAGAAGAASGVSPSTGSSVGAGSSSSGPGGSPVAGAAEGSDLESALQLASGMVPPSTTGRILLVSDGNETRGALARAIPGLLARGFPVDVRLTPEASGDDISIERVELPAGVRVGEEATLVATIHATGTTSATVRLLREDSTTAEQTVELQLGGNRIEFPISEATAGSYLYEVEVEGPRDRVLENDRNGTIATILAPPRVVIVTPQTSWGETLGGALALQGVTASVVSPDQAPGGVGAGAASARWSDFDAAILMNVPAADLTPNQIAGLERWVRQSGGGLTILGGENTFGPGGYFDTPLETISPLSSKIPQEVPDVAVMFVIDRSGSMAQTVGYSTRLLIAKAATLQAAELIDDEGLVGVVAFDQTAATVAALQPARDRERLESRLRNLMPGGGTAIYAGLERAFSQLAQVDPNFKRHIVLMSDGLSQPADFTGIMSQIAEEGITVSTVAISPAADVELLAEIATLGSGASHYTRDVNDLPSILTREISRFTAEAVSEDTVTATWRDRGADFLQAFPTAPPPLLGYVKSSEKPGATVHLAIADDVPLLASWRYGLGRVAAFASHGAGPWVATWMSDPEYPAWWAQVVRSTLPATPNPGLTLHVARDRDYARITVEALNSEGEPLSGLELMARVADPAGGEMPVRLMEGEPGVYRGEFIADRAGSYTVSVSPPAGAGETIQEPAEARLYVGYPAIYSAESSGADLLRAVAAASGGRVLSEDDPVFTDPVPLRWVWRPAWPLWSLLAIALFMVDLVIRYGRNFLPRVGEERGAAA